MKIETKFSENEILSLKLNFRNLIMQEQGQNMGGIYRSEKKVKKYKIFISQK
jgi:hypothetical protein